MPSDLLAKIDAILSDADPDNDVSVLSLVPFFEVHLTKLADWISRDTAKTKAKVTSNAIPDRNNEVDDGTLDGGGSVYSRGLVQSQTGATTGDTLIIASARNHNTGLTNTAPINPGEDEGHRIDTTATETSGPYYYSDTNPEPSPAEHKDGSIAVSVGSGLSITVAFQQAFGSKKVNANAIDTPIVSGVDVNNCGPVGATDAIEAYSCTVPENLTSAITFTFSPSDSYSFCLTDNGSADTSCTELPAGEWRVPTPVTTTINQTIYVWRP